MRGLIFVTVIAMVAFIVVNELRDPPESMLTERDKIERFLADYTFNSPKDIVVLFQREDVDNKTREKVKTLVLRTDEEYIPRSPRIPDQSMRVFTALTAMVPEHDFGAPIDERAGYFQWLGPNTQWKVSSVVTSTGHYSLWERREDVYQLTN